MGASEQSDSASDPRQPTDTPAPAGSAQRPSGEVVGPTPPIEPEPESAGVEYVVAEVAGKEPALKTPGRLEPGWPTGAEPRRPIQPPPQRRIALPVFLFAATCLSTFWVGATNWMPLHYTDGMAMRKAVITGWQTGLIYMGCVLAILFAHEMGHFLATLRYRIPASLPYFIPFPIMPLGTMGAVIGMDGLRANRRQLFDIGIAGPLAGLVIAVPVLWIGIRQLDFGAAGFGGYVYDLPLMARWMIDAAHPDSAGLRSLHSSQLNPYFMAGWVGLLVTGLNMLPISQLDGGHVTYTLFGRTAHIIARLFLLGAIAYVVLEGVQIWTLMIVLVTFLGTDHPPTSDDRVKLGPVRTVLGCASLAIPLLCFPPRGLYIENFWQ